MSATELADWRQCRDADATVVSVVHCESAVVGVVTIMQRNLTCEVVLSTVLGVLCRWCEDGVVAPTVVAVVTGSDGFMDTLVTVMNAFPSNESIMREACCLVWRCLACGQLAAGPILMDPAWRLRMQSCFADATARFPSTARDTVGYFAAHALRLMGP